MSVSAPDDRPLLGIALMLGGCLLAPLGDGRTKLLSYRVDLLALVTIRFRLSSLCPFAGPSAADWPLLITLGVIGALAALGIIATVTAGLYVITREQRAARASAPRPAPPAAE